MRTFKTGFREGKGAGKERESQEEETGKEAVKMGLVLKHSRKTGRHFLAFVHHSVIHKFGAVD